MGRKVKRGKKKGQDVVGNMTSEFLYFNDIIMNRNDSSLKIFKYENQDTKAPGADSGD